jgi:molybdopterin synthase sulfur carrier subunit
MIDTATTMTVRVLCVAQLRDHIGEPELRLPLAEGSTAQALLHALQARHPAIAPLLRVCRVAVNCKYVAPEAVLHADDEVVVIPPVSGG